MGDDLSLSCGLFEMDLAWFLDSLTTGIGFDHLRLKVRKVRF